MTQKTIRLRTQRGHVDIDVPKFVEAYKSQMRNEDIAQAFGVSRMRILELRQLLRLPHRTEHLASKRLGGTPEPDPTPEEIRERAAIERSKWSPEEEERRFVGPRAVPAMMLSYSSHVSRNRSNLTFRESAHGF